LFARRDPQHQLENLEMKWMILALLGLAAACNETTTPAPRPSVSAFGSPQADLTRYQTFSFASANPPVVGFETTQRSLEVERRLTSLVQASLEKRGYAANPDKPDLLIKISAGSGTLPGEKVQRGNATLDKPGGFIGVDAYDRATGVAVWHGVGVAQIDPAHIDDQLLEQGVERIFADFPRRSEQAPLGKLDR
jgi:hypothetical protein